MKLNEISDNKGARYKFKRVGRDHADFGSLRFTSIACVGSTIWVGTEHGRLFRLDDWGQAAPREVHGLKLWP